MSTNTPISSAETIDLRSKTSLQAKDKELEKTEKSRAVVLWDWVISILPIAAVILLELHYILVPNHGINTSTNVYPLLVSMTGVVYGISLLRGIIDPKIREKNRYKAPLYTAIFLIFTVYDYLTLKTGILILPYFPWPDRIINAAIGDRKILGESVYSSMRLLFTGYFIGVGVGLVTGVLAGWYKKVFYWVSPIIKVLGPIPATTWLPIVTIVAASLYSGSVFLIALGVWYPVTLTTIIGVSNVRKTYFEVAKTLGAGEKELIFQVAIPAASTNIFTGLTQGMGIACTTLIVAEMMGVESGLGWYINWQRGWAEFAKMYAALIIICLTFTVVNVILAGAKKRALRWQEGTVK